MLKFYILKDIKLGESSFETDFIIEEPCNLGPADYCKSCNHTIGPFKWIPPHKAEIERWGKDFGDIAFGQGDNLLVSQYFKDAYMSYQLKGITDFMPVEILKCKNRKKLTPPYYYCIQVNYGNAVIDDEASSIEYDIKPTCETCLRSGIKRLKRVALRNGTWSGEDIFIARGLSGILWYPKDSI